MKSVGPDGFAFRSVANDTVMISSANITILNEKILRILREVRGVHDADSRSTIGL